MSDKYFKYRIQGGTLVIRIDHAALVIAIDNTDGERSPVEQRLISFIKEFVPRMSHKLANGNIVVD